MFKQALHRLPGGGWLRHFSYRCSAVGAGVAFKELLRDRWRRRDLLASLRVDLGFAQTDVDINGVSLCVDLRDIYVGRWLYIHKEYEPLETKVISAALRPGDTFVDIGANIGYFTTLASRAVGPAGRVFAFEPETRNFAMLTRNIGRACGANVRPVNAALGEREGEVVLHVSATNWGDNRIAGVESVHTGTQSVRMVRADDVLEAAEVQAVDVIKMDVQGFEGQVVRGLARTLDSSPNCCILMELWPWGLAQAGASAQEVFTALEGGHRSAYMLKPEGQLEPVNLAEALAAVPSLDTNPPDRCYINVLFAPRERGERLAASLAHGATSGRQ